MKALKFTGMNRTATHGVTDYPPVGEWSESRVPQLCASGWHIAAPDRLAAWLAAELWEVEVDGASVYGDDKSAHERIRFVRQLPWAKDDVAAFAENCAEKAQEYAASAERTITRLRAGAAAAANAARYAAWSASCTASGANAVSYAAWSANAARAAARAARAAGYASAARAAGYASAASAADAERRRQSQWIRDRVGWSV